jgi:hypothetical protein
MIARAVCFAGLCVGLGGCWAPCGECPASEPTQTGAYDGALDDGRVVDVVVTDDEVTVTSVDANGDTWVARYAVQ